MSDPPQSVNNIFQGAHDFSMSDVQFTEVIKF